ncbi:MAG TPA: sialidase family protein, partial [Candidatus Sulfomarinibacteraceae bacterium]|nr:sialidase family protein [Candidatus Sulfomarinibacteraceae bacterium]
MIRLTSVLLTVTCTLLAVGTALPADATTGPSEQSDLRIVAPEGSTVRFSSFVEDGRRFTSVSTDGGDTWSEPRAMMDRISLLAGPIVPGERAPALPKNLAAGDELRVFIVQLETQSLAEWRRQLAALGAEVLTWVPYD